MLHTVQQNALGNCDISRSLTGSSEIINGLPQMLIPGLITGMRSSHVMLQGQDKKVHSQRPQVVVGNKTVSIPPPPHNIAVSPSMLREHPLLSFLFIRIVIMMVLNEIQNFENG